MAALKLLYSICALCNLYFEICKTTTTTKEVIHVRVTLPNLNSCVCVKGGEVKVGLFNIITLFYNRLINAVTIFSWLQTIF